MRRYIVFALLTLCLTAYGQNTGKPKIKFDSTECDLGRISADGGQKSCDFTFRNIGEAPLVILKANTSCNCTVAKHPKKPIMPGDSAVITITYDPKTQSGAFFKAIQIYSNDPLRRSVVSVRGEVY